MDTAALVVSIVLALIMGAAAGGKLMRAEPVVRRMARAGIGEALFPWLAAVELAGGLGLLVGIGSTRVSIAAAGLLTVYLGVALIFQARVRDEGIASSLGLLAMAGSILWLRLFTG